MLSAFVVKRVAKVGKRCIRRGPLKKAGVENALSAPADFAVVAACVLAGVAADTPKCGQCNQRACACCLRTCKNQFLRTG